MSEELAAIRAWAASPPPDGHVDVTHLRAALAEVARLTAEVERLSAMVPRWAYTHRGRMWRLVCAGAKLADSGLSAFPGDPVLDTTTGDEYPDLPTACRAVCARLGLPDILPPTDGT